MRKIFLSLLLAACTMSMYAVDGMLPGYFSVSATKTVAFSQGNLQAVAIPFHWRFADHQYDAIGNAPGNTTDVGARTAQKDSIDLYGWGTGDPNKLNMAFSASTTASDYSTFADWGGAVGDGWFTLSKDEWEYLFVGRTDAATKFGLAIVNGINGLILLPDEWTDPEPNAKSFTPSTTAATPLEWSSTFHYYTRGYFSFSDNNYTAEEWTALEDAGAVFLPSTAYRTGTTCYDATWGCYWSSTPLSGGEAYHLLFRGDEVEPSTTHTVSMGQAVRLVREAQVGDRFKVAVGSDTLQYQVTSVSPYKVKVTQSGHFFNAPCDLIIPASVKYLGQTFAVTEIEYNPNFANVRTLQLPASLTKVTWGAANLSSLEAFIVQAGSTVYSTYDGVLYSPDKKILYRCPPKHEFKSADFLPATEEIGDDAFRKTLRIGDLVIPNTINYIGARAFSGSSITSVVIPKSVTNLFDTAFGSCENLTSVTFENSAAIDLAWNTFAGSKILEDQTDDFQVIDSLAIKYNGTNAVVVLPDTIVNIAYSFIYVDNDPSSSDAAAENLTTVILPATLKTVQHQFLAFNTSPRAKYPKLEKIICKAQSVPVVSDELELSSEKDVTLVVPSGKADTYKNTFFSVPFAKIEEEINYVEVTVVCPIIGDSIIPTVITQAKTALWNVTGEVSIPDNVNYKLASYGIYQENGQWPTESHILPGKTYMMGVDLVPSEGYAWPSNGFMPDWLRMTITVNGAAPDRLGYGVKSIQPIIFFTTTATGMEEVTGNGLPVTGKEIRNGQLFILRDGKTYNALGVEVK